VIAAIISATTDERAEFYLLFCVTCVLTCVTLFGLGSLSSIFTNHSWWRAGFFTLTNGVVASGASYLIGWLVGLIMAKHGISPLNV